MNTLKIRYLTYCRSAIFVVLKGAIFLTYFLAALGLHCCAWAFSSCGTLASHFGGFSRGAWAGGHTSFSSCGTRAWLPTTCGIFQDQGLNLCPLHWQMDS